MLAIKLIGGILLFATGGLTAVSLCRYCRKRLETLDGFVSLIQYVKGQVECYARPIDDILASLPPEILRDCNCPTGASSLDELIEASSIYLDRDSHRHLVAFSGEFGSIFREEQARRCQHYASLLGERRQAVAERLVSEMRSGCAVCICVTVSLAILLW